MAAALQMLCVILITVIALYSSYSGNPVDKIYPTIIGMFGLGIRPSTMGEILKKIYG